MGAKIELTDDSGRGRFYVRYIYARGMLRPRDAIGLVDIEEATTYSSLDEITGVGADLRMKNSTTHSHLIIYSFNTVA